MSGDQQRFIDAVTGMGDVLVYAASTQTQDQAVRDGLVEIADIIEGLLDMRGASSEVFLSLAADARVLDADDAQQVAFTFALDPSRALVGFSIPLKQIARVHQVASRAGNGDIARAAAYQLSEVLSRLTSQVGNAALIGATIENLRDVMREAMRNKCESRYIAVYQWYFDAVFTRPELYGRRFQLPYLEALDSALWGYLKYAVSQGDSEVFEAFISWVVNGVSRFSRRERITDSLYSALFALQRDVYRALDESGATGAAVGGCERFDRDAATPEAVDEVATNLRALFESAEGLIDETARVELKRTLTSVLDEAHSKVKSDRLDEIMFSVGSYCVFRQRYDFVRYMVEFNQPPDSIASWVNSDVLPDTPSKLLRFYFGAISDSRRFHYFDDHHGREVYDRRLLLTLLARQVGTQPIDEETGKRRAVEVSLGDAQAVGLSNITHTVDGLLATIASVVESEDLCALVSSSVDEGRRILEEDVFALLETVKQQALKTIDRAEIETPMSESKLREFREDVLRGFFEDNSLRNLFTDFPHLYRRDDATEDLPERFGISTIYDKAAFFDEWHVHYVGGGKGYGSAIANDEARKFVNALSERCATSAASSISECLDSIDDLDGIVCLASALAGFRLYLEPSVFRPTNHPDAPPDASPHLHGWLVYDSQWVPVYKMGGWRPGAELLFVDPETIGEFVQLPPIDAGDDPDAVEDIFLVTVEELTNNAAFMKRLKADPPEWVLERKSDLTAEDYVRTKVWIRVLERFRFDFQDDVRGVRLALATTEEVAEERSRALEQSKEVQGAEPA